MDSGPGRHLDCLMGGGMISMKRISLFGLAIAAAFLAGCASVKPWERETLSRQGMQIDPNPMFSQCDNHIYFSREASKGGSGFGGGGCGCN